MLLTIGNVEFARYFSLPALWRTAVLLVVLSEVAVSQGDECSDGGGSCVLPQPLSEHKGSQDLDALWLEVRCYLGCVDQVSERLSFEVVIELKMSLYYLAFFSLHTLTGLSSVWWITECKFKFEAQLIKLFS